VSLFAENFHEMIQRDFGYTIFQSMLNYVPPPRKRKRGKEEDIPSKKKKVENDSIEEKNENSEELKVEEKEIEEPPKTIIENIPKSINENLQRAFFYFDRNRVGFIRTDDLSTMIHSIGLFLSNNYIKEILDKIAIGRRIKYDEIVEQPIINLNFG